MRPESRDALLIAIAKAPGWIDDIRLGRIGSFAEIAEREVQGERHIRLLAPLAFLSPRIIVAIVHGTAPADLTVTGLAKALPYSWIEQEQRVGFPKGTPRTGLCQQSNRSAARRNGNWKMAPRDPRPKPAPQGSKSQKSPVRDWGAPA